MADSDDQEQPVCLSKVEKKEFSDTGNHYIEDEQAVSITPLKFSALFVLSIFSCCLNILVMAGFCW